MEKIKQAIETLEGAKGKAPEVQQGAIALALNLLQRADNAATPAQIEAYHGVREWVLCQYKNNEECESPHRKTAEAIICRLIA